MAGRPSTRATLALALSFASLNICSHTILCGYHRQHNNNSTIIFFATLLCLFIFLLRESRRSDSVVMVAAAVMIIFYFSMNATDSLSLLHI